MEAADGADVDDADVDDADVVEADAMEADAMEAPVDSSIPPATPAAPAVPGGAESLSPSGTDADMSEDDMLDSGTADDGMTDGMTDGMGDEALDGEALDGEMTDEDEADLDGGKTDEDEEGFGSDTELEDDNLMDKPSAGDAPGSPEGISPVPGGTPVPLTPTTPDGGPTQMTPAPVNPAPVAPPAMEPIEPTPEFEDDIEDDATQTLPPTSSGSSDRLIGEGFTPFQLAYLAVWGGLEEEGIPGGKALLNAYEDGEIEASDVVAAGAMSKRLGTAASNESEYTKGVDKMLHLLGRTGLSSN